MPNLMLIKREDGSLYPGDKWAKAAVDKWSVGEGVIANVRRPRNILHHRKLFALLNYMVENTDHFPDTDKALEALKLFTGLTETKMYWNGKKYQEIVQLKSIAFESMDQDTFSEWYERALDKVAEITRDDPKLIRQRILEFMA